MRQQAVYLPGVKTEQSEPAATLLVSRMAELGFIPSEQLLHSLMDLSAIIVFEKKTNYCSFS